MTQPPYGDQPLPPYGDEPQPAYGQPPQYPHQELLPQQVQPGRSRWPLIVGAVVVVLAVVAALVIWRVVHDDGEESRAAYCNELKKLTTDDGLGGLAQAVGGGGTGVPKVLDQLRDLAPSSVRSQWDDLIALVSNGPPYSSDVATIARAFTDLQTIVGDANSECGMDLQIPG